MPLRHEPPTLTTACLTTIARHFEYLVYGVKHKKDMAAILEDDSYLSYTGPFQHMPSAILEKALSVIQDESTIRHVQTRHLHVLLQPQLEYLKLTFGSGDIHKALELLQLRCKRLRKLNISYLRTIEPTLLTKLAPHLTQLVTLDLSNTETTDSVLAAIALHCPLLRELNTSFCPVSSKVLERLFWDARRRVKMCRLVTSVNLTGCQVSPVTIRTGLQLQPTLRHAEFENNLLAFDPDYSGLWEEEMTFSLLGLSGQGVDISDDTMEMVTTLCPFVTSLSLSCCNINNDSLIRGMAWENLTQLRLTNTEKETIHFGESVLPILTARGHQMTALLLSRFTYIDVIAIATTCPKLENLALSNITLYEPVLMGPREDFFKQLQALEVWADFSTTTLSGAVLRLVLGSSGALRNLLISGCDQLTDVLLSELWADHNPMQKLARVTIDSCPHFSMLSLEQLFDMKNELGCVRVWNCPNVTKDHEKALFRKIAQGNMDVYFEWYAWTG